MGRKKGKSGELSNVEKRFKKLLRGKGRKAKRELRRPFFWGTQESSRLGYHERRGGENFTGGIKSLRGDLLPQPGEKTTEVLSVKTRKGGKKTSISQKRKIILIREL